MRLILKKDIIENIIDTIAEANANGDSVEMIYLDKDEYDRYKTSCAKAQFSTGPGRVCGVEIRQVPEYDLFYDEEYWIEHDFTLDDKLNAAGVDVYHTGIFMVYHGQAYRKVSNLAGDPAPVKNVSKSDFCFKTESEGIPIPTMPDKKLIARLQDKFNWGVLTSNETTDLIKHQRKHIRNLEAKVRNNYVNCDHSFSLGA